MTKFFSSLRKNKRVFSPHLIVQGANSISQHSALRFLQESSKPSKSKCHAFGFRNKTFLEASKRGDVERMKQALARGARIDACDEEGCTALHHTAGHPHDAALEYLVQEGDCRRRDFPDFDTDPGAFFSGDAAFLNRTSIGKRQTALHVAAGRNHVGACRRLLDAGASWRLTDHMVRLCF